MPYGMYAECPQCGLTAHGKDEIEALFGFRYDGTMPQSWCRACRSSANHSSGEKLPNPDSKCKDSGGKF